MYRVPVECYVHNELTVIKSRKSPCYTSPALWNLRKCKHFRYLHLKAWGPKVVLILTFRLSKEPPGLRSIVYSTSATGTLHALSSLPSSDLGASALKTASDKMGIETLTPFIKYPAALIRNLRSKLITPLNNKIYITDQPPLIQLNYWLVYKKKFFFFL